MRFDVQASVRGALDVCVPAFDLEGVRARTARRVRAGAQRTVRSMMAFGALVACVAVFAAGSSAGASSTQVAMRTSVPAPEPVST